MTAFSEDVERIRSIHTSARRRRIVGGGWQGKGWTMVGVPLGTLVLSIDLELDHEHHQTHHHRRLDEVRRQLLDMTRVAGVPATWAVADPLLSAATEPVLAAGVGHE